MRQAKSKLFIATISTVLSLTTIGCKIGSKESSSSQTPPPTNIDPGPNGPETPAPSGPTNYTVTASGTNVTISPDTAQTVASGATKSFNVSASFGYTLSDTVTGTCPLGTWTTPGSDYSTGAITADCTVIFSAAISTFSVTPSGTNVTISPNSAQTVNFGNTQVFTVSATAGFEVSPGVGGTCDAGSWTTPGSVYQTGAIQQNCTVVFSAMPTTKWAQTSSSTSENIFKSIATDSLGNIYAVGYITGTTPFDFGNGVSAQGAGVNKNGVLVKYNSAGVAQWATTASSGGYQSLFNSIAIDSNDNIFVVGTIAGNSTYNFGNNVTVAGSVNSGSLLLIKYNSSGTAQWAKTNVLGTLYSEFYSVAVDGSGNIFASGIIQGTLTSGSAVDFGNSVYVSGSANTSGLVVKFNSSGVAQWAKSQTAGTSATNLYSVATDSNGDLYVGGIVFNGTGTSFGDNVSVTTTGSIQRPLLIKYSSAGVTQWAQTLAGGTQEASFNAVTTDASGNIYAAGKTSGYDNYGFDFGNNVIIYGSGQYNGVLVKYNSSGVAQWAKAPQTGASNEYHSVKTDSTGNIYVGGLLYLSATLNLGNSVITNGSAETSNSLVFKCDSTGTPQWARSTSAGSGESRISSIALDNSGSVFAAGRISSDTYGFGSSVSATATGINSLLLKY